jgi:hypothetical protein
MYLRRCVVIVMGLLKLDEFDTPNTFVDIIVNREVESARMPASTAWHGLISEADFMCSQQWEPKTHDLKSSTDRHKLLGLVEEIY